MLNQIKKYCAIIPINETSPIAFINVYETGDCWIKIQGCEKCPEDRRRLCCGNCGMLTPDGKCSWQMTENRSHKPLNCVIWPTPDQCKKGCQLKYKSIAGSLKGTVRSVSDAKRSVNVKVV
jgi:hypothetical protein